MIDFLLTIAEQSFLFAPLVFGGYLTVALMKLPDLSLEASFLAGAIAANSVISFYGTITTINSIIAIIFFPILAGAIIGGFNFFLTRITKLPHLLSSMITIGLMHGISQIIMQTSLLPLASHQTLLTIISEAPEYVTIGILFIINALLLHFFLKSALGVCLAVYGSNPQFFSHYHISTNAVVAFGLMIGNGLAGLSGGLIAQTHGFVEITMSTGTALQAITALMLGNLIFKLISSHKKSSIIIPVTGIFLYFIIQQTLLRLGFDLKYFTAIQALAVLILMITQYRSDDNKKINQLGV